MTEFVCVGVLAGQPRHASLHVESIGAGRQLEQPVDVGAGAMQVAIDQDEFHGIDEAPVAFWSGGAETCGRKEGVGRRMVGAVCAAFLG